MSVKFGNLEIGGHIINIGTIRDIRFHDYTHIEIDYGSNCTVDLHKDDYWFSDWDYFVHQLMRVFEV